LIAAVTSYKVDKVAVISELPEDNSVSLISGAVPIFIFSLFLNKLIDNANYIS
jgi:hypothetical protein